MTDKQNLGGELQAFLSSSGLCFCGWDPWKMFWSALAKPEATPVFISSAVETLQILAAAQALVLHQPKLPGNEACGLIEMSILYCCDCTIPAHFAFCFPHYLPCILNLSQFHPLKPFKPLKH